jgi:hypothetical protein
MTIRTTMTGIRIDTLGSSAGTREGTSTGEEGGVEAGSGTGIVTGVGLEAGGQIEGGTTSGGAPLMGRPAAVTRAAIISHTGAPAGSCWQALVASAVLAMCLCDGYA